jgi:serine/threonine protein kinase
MPDNTWFTPYKFPASECLSFGPSQGIVFRLSKRSVVKLPFQYPVSDIPTNDTIDHIHLSLRSFVVFKKECKFYDLLAANPHPNIAQKLESGRRDCIIVEYVNPVKHAWGTSTKEARLNWIEQLLMALEWIEKLGYTHGDITVSNMGIDYNGQLKLFDFGSVTHRDEDNFQNQVLDDHFNLAICIHFLASGIDHLARAESLADLKRIRRELERGIGAVDKEAKDFEKVIQAGWTRLTRSPSSFSQLRKNVADITGNITANGFYSPLKGYTSSSSVNSDELPEREPRWMDEKDYRAAWERKGFDVPADIWC